MIERYLRLLDLYKQSASPETEREARALLLEARTELDRLTIAGENISDITRYISEVEYYLFDHIANNN